MFRFSSYVASVLFALTLCTFATMRAHAGSAQGIVSLLYVHLQATTPGTPQTGHANITGTMIAGQFQGGGAGLTSLNASNISAGTLNAARLPVPFTLSGTIATWVIKGENSAAVDGASGVFGFASGGGVTRGVVGESDSPSGRGVYGYAAAPSGTTYGVYEQSSSTSGIGVRGDATAASGATYGVYGQSSTTGGTATGVYGTANTYGVFAQSAFTGVRGESTSASGQTFGGFFVCRSTSGAGVVGQTNTSSGTSSGVNGSSISGNDAGVYGFNGAISGDAFGGYFESNSRTGRGVYGIAGQSADTGVAGVYGGTFSTQPTGYGVYCYGNLAATGTKAFVIDDPLDPTNKYLKHYCAEGPEPQNIYNGTITTGTDGYALVELPEYYGEMNKEPRYQLTVVDGSDDFIQAKVSREIEGNRFQIRTSKPGVKVCWEVKAVRNDLWVRSYGAPVEVAKEEAERGKYLNPELHGLPPKALLKARSMPQSRKARGLGPRLGRSGA